VIPGLRVVVCFSRRIQTLHTGYATSIELPYLFKCCGQDQCGKKTCCTSHAKTNRTYRQVGRIESVYGRMLGCWGQVNVSSLSLRTQERGVDVIGLPAVWRLRNVRKCRGCSSITDIPENLTYMRDRSSPRASKTALLATYDTWHTRTLQSTCTVIIENGQEKEKSRTLRNTRTNSQWRFWMKGTG